MDLLRREVPATSLVVAIDPGKVFDRVWLTTGERGLIGDPVTLPVLRDGVDELERLTPVFAPLPTAIVENLALRARRRAFVAGAAVITQGDAGDSFYVIEQGTVDVHEDGVLRRRERESEFFSEIALLRDVPRTATVADERRAPRRRSRRSVPEQPPERPVGASASRPARAKRERHAAAARAWLFGAGRLASGRCRSARAAAGACRKRSASLTT